MTAIILQARMDSRRLPGKSLLPLKGKALVFRVMEALNHVQADIRVLACPDDCAGDFAPLAEEARFELFLGPKDDVLSRYCMAIRHYKADLVIRATGDNPFVFADAANALVPDAAELQADYAVYWGIPHGSGVEILDSEALLRAGRESVSPIEREHVSPYLYHHSEIFKVHRPLAPRIWQGNYLRVTVDNAHDFNRAEILYEGLDREAQGDDRYQGEQIIKVYRSIMGNIPAISEDDDNI
jgi:spore coat polysaccharide biosynthesis protein SpsF